MVLLPRSVENIQPLFRARVAIIMLLKSHAILARFLRPPRRNNIQSKTPVADVIDICRLFCQQRRQVKCWPHRDHQFNSFGHRCKRSCRRPRVQRRRFHSLDVVQIQLGNQRQVEAHRLAALRQLLHIGPRRLHVFVLDVAQPSAKNRKPVSVSHRGAPVLAAFSALSAF